MRGAHLVVDADQQLVAMVGDAAPIRLLIVPGKHDVTGGAEPSHEGPVWKPKHGPMLI